jgi:hypothetical protein
MYSVLIPLESNRLFNDRDLNVSQRFCLYVRISLNNRLYFLSDMAHTNMRIVVIYISIEGKEISVVRTVTGLGFVIPGTVFCFLTGARTLALLHTV